MQNKTKIILGSKSVWRKQTLKKMGYKFRVIDPNIDEKAIRNKDPKKLVLAIARAKAQAILSRINEAAIIITSDLVVRCHGKILEKPRDKNEARKFLHMHALYPTETITAVVVTNTVTKKEETGVDITKIWFAPIPENVIEKIASQKHTLECAGGFTIEDPLLKNYVLKIKGTTDSALGMPIKLTQKLIAKSFCPGGTDG